MLYLLLLAPGVMRGNMHTQEMDNWTWHSQFFSKWSFNVNVCFVYRMKKKKNRSCLSIQTAHILN